MADPKRAWLRAALAQDAGPLSLVNERTGAVIAPDLELAIDSATRRRGLLGRDGLPEGHALLLAPCQSVHTFFMRFPIDIVFVRRDGRVIAVSHETPAWRMRTRFRAFAVVEFPAGAAARVGVQPGDPLKVVAVQA